jgi:GDP-L-fucose synthase
MISILSLPVNTLIVENRILQLNPKSKIYIAGHNGMVGSAIRRKLTSNGYVNLLGFDSNEVDLTHRDATFEIFDRHKPDVVIMAAAKVGGIKANQNSPVEFLNVNLRIQTNIFEASHQNEVNRLLFLGSSCIYPKRARQPINEKELLTGKLEPTNEAYAIAKISGILGVQSYRQEYGRNWISAMPTNLYGPGDNYDLETSHVFPALIKKIVDAKKNNSPEVIIWGNGKAKREFLHVDDLASACLFLLENYNEASPVNVGYGTDISIRNLARLIASTVGYSGKFVFDTSKPNGMQRKLLDSGLIHSLGWLPKIKLEEGIRATAQEYQGSV